MTSPPATVPKPPKGTPFKTNADGKGRYAFHKPQGLQKREDYCDEMLGLIIGPLEVTEYLERFVPVNDEQALPSAPRVAFDAVPLEEKKPLEKDMYQPLIDQFKLLTPGFEWFRSAEEIGRDGLRLRPDISFIETGRWSNSSTPQEGEKKEKEKTKAPARSGDPPPGPFDWKRCEFGVEVKRSCRADAFTDRSKDTVEADSQEGRWSRGQLISYVKEQMSRQHRTGMHQLFICGDYARLLYFDRSGGVVTKRFNYHTHPEFIADFLWRYSHLDQGARGWDPSVVSATDEEVQLFDERVGQFVKDFGTAPERNPDRLSSKLFAASLGHKAGYPTFKIKLESQGYTGTLLIRQPFFEPFSPVGRATRGYVAYVVETEETVFLKDTWRTTHGSERKSEAEVYAFLESRRIPNIPEILYAADVRGPDGDVQETFLHKYALEIPPTVRPFGHLRGHIHCRIVQRLAFPLSSFRNSKELVRVLRDTLITIRDAYQAGLLHRDISLGNVMIKKDGSGVLNDWDHSRELPSETSMTSQAGKTKDFRTGTWQFMSIHVLESPDRRHTVLDDIESVYWLLLYCALHWLPHNDKFFNMQFFDEQSPKELENSVPTTVGGLRKRHFLQNTAFESLQFTSAPLNELLQDLAWEFRAIYWYETAREPDLKERAQAASKKLEDATFVLGLFEKALRSDAWPKENDRVADQFRSKTFNEEKRAKHRNAVLSFDSTSSYMPSDPPTHQSLPSDAGSGTDRRSKSQFLMHKAAILASTSSSTDSGLMPENMLPSDSGPIAGPSMARHFMRSSRGGSSMSASTSYENSPKRKRDSTPEEENGSSDPDSPTGKRSRV